MTFSLSARRRPTLAMWLGLAWLVPLLVVDAVGAAGEGEFATPNPWVVLEGILPAVDRVDATAPCFPEEVVAHAPALAGAERGRLLQELDALDRRISVGEGGDWTAPLRAVLVARTSRERLALDTALDVLVSMAHDFPNGRTRSCYQLEAARLELFRHNYPEAAAWARRVEDTSWGDAASDHAAVREGAAFLRAESLYLSGRRLQAQRLYERLEGSAQRSIASASRLRAADLSADSGRPEAAFARYQELLPQASSFGGEAETWGARVGEAAFQAGDYAAALAWFQRYAQQTDDPRARALAEIRVADSAALLGKIPEARALLRDIAEFAADLAVRDLAGVRLAVPPVGSRAAGEELELLRRATASSNPRVSQYARAELGRGALEAGEVFRALEVLTRLAFESPDPSLAPWLDVHLADAIERVVERASSEKGCRKVIEVIGWRRNFLLQHSDRAAPFLHLGKCYEDAGLPRQAIHLYRSVVKRFGLRVSEDVSLPLARAALGAGEIGVAKASAEARVEDAAGPAWERLLADVYLVEGREADALETLRGLLESNQDQSALRAEATWLFALLGLRLGEFEEIRPLLSAADPWLRADGGLSEAQRGDVFWVRAESTRRVGLLAPARRDYRAAISLLHPGPRRASAEYWLGVLEEDPEQERLHYEAGEGTDTGGLWAELAGEELALSRLRERYGRPRELRE